MIEKSKIESFPIVNVRSGEVREVKGYYFEKIVSDSGSSASPATRMRRTQPRCVMAGKATTFGVDANGIGGLSGFVPAVTLANTNRSASSEPSGAFSGSDAVTAESNGVNFYADAHE